MRIGNGYDIHRIIPTLKPGSIPIGGVDIPCFYRVQAHSDGDVLIHALVDACLGALALGDIGQWFPDTDPKNQNKVSSEFLKLTLDEVRRLGFFVHQIDCTLFLEEPKVSPHTDKIRRNLANLLSTELSQISVKAKTMEGLGPIGERKALAAQVSVVLLERKS